MLENLKKFLKFHQGSEFDVGDRVIILDKEILRLPRKIAAIGWNNTGGHYFYAVSGVKDRLFLSSDLLDYAYHRGPIGWKKDESPEKAVILARSK